MTARVLVVDDIPAFSRELVALLSEHADSARAREDAGRGAGKVTGG